MKPNTGMPNIELSLDERNLAHVLTALAIAGIADAHPDATVDDRCWWAEEVFVLDIPLNNQELFKKAHELVMSMKWVAGIGAAAKGNVAASAHHGLFVADGCNGCNPLLDYKSQGIESSIFKTFSGQQSPATPLKRQQEQLQAVDAQQDWLFQEYATPRHSQSRVMLTTWSPVEFGVLSDMYTKQTVSVPATGPTGVSNRIRPGRNHSQGVASAYPFGVRFG